MKRIYYYDNAKFILIISVILGHLLQINGLNDRISVGLFDTIFMYSMPLFVFISGLFTPPTKRGNPLLSFQFWLSELGLLETMVTFSLIMKLPVLIIKGMSLYEFLMPGYTLWYLLALIWWRLISVLLPEWILRHKPLLLIVSIAVSLFSGFLSRGNLFALPRTLFFLPFFIAGFCLSSKREQLVSTIRRIPLVSSIVAILLIIVINIVIGYNQLPFNTGNVPFYRWEMDLAEALPWRFIFSTLCVIVSIAVLRLIPDGKVMISEYGSKSLVLYVYHAIILFGIDLLFRHFRLPTNIYIAFAEFLVVVPILMIIAKNKFANSIVSPITRLIKRKIKKYE